MTGQTTTNKANVTVIGATRPGARWTLTWMRNHVGAWWNKILRMTRRPPRRLRLSEHLALGERRFVAVIEFEQSRFLLGGTAGSLALLAHLPPANKEHEAFPEEQR
jgi:hypothetical protein